MDTIRLDELTIPFGKYKGQDVSKLFEDHKYLKWCQDQPWFKEKYSNIYNIVVNQTFVRGGATGDKTPEHNKIQNLFLDNDLCSKLWVAITGDPKAHSELGVEFEGEFNWDIIFDKSIYDCYGDTKLKILTEVKPSLGDDYPNVLRKMKQQFKLTKKSDRFDYKHKVVLLLNSFDSVNTSRDDLRKIFDQSDIKVVYLSELDINLKQHVSIEDENKILKDYLTSINVDYKQLLNQG